MGLVDTLNNITTVIYPDMQNIQAISQQSAQDAAASAQDAAGFAVAASAIAAQVAAAKVECDNVQNVIYPDIQSKLLTVTQKVVEANDLLRITEQSLDSVVSADLDITGFLNSAQRDAQQVADAKDTVERLINQLSTLTGGIISISGGGSGVSVSGGVCDDNVFYTYPKGQGAINKFKPEAHQHCDLLSKAEFEVLMTKALTSLKFFWCYEKAAANLLPKAGGLMNGDLEFVTDGFAIVDPSGEYWMIVVADDGALMSISGAVLPTYTPDTPILDATDPIEIAARIAKKISLSGDTASAPLFFAAGSGVVCFDGVGVSWRSTIGIDGALVSETMRFAAPSTAFGCGQVSYSEADITTELEGKADKNGDLMSGDAAFGSLSGVVFRSPAGYLFRLGIDASGAYLTTQI